MTPSRTPRSTPGPHGPAADAFGAPLDVLAIGQLFLDVLYGPLPTAPTLGHEIHTDGAELVPGGIANFTAAAAALGARTGLAALIGDGTASHLVRELLESSGIATDHLVARPGWDLPITSALAYDGDRALVTGGATPELELPAVFTADPQLDGTAIAAHLQIGEMAWLDAVDPDRNRVFADVGWDPTGRWDPSILRHLARCFAFCPNADEATAYARTDTPLAAARALAELTPITVVTCGGDGAIAIDARTGEEVHVAAVDLGPVDPTGAGDTFGASLIVMLRAGLPLRSAVEASCLAATARAAAIVGPGRTPPLDRLAELARTHRLACADDLTALVAPVGPTADPLTTPSTTPSTASLKEQS